MFTKTICVEEDEEEETYANKDTTKFIMRKKHKVTSNPKQTTHFSIICNTGINEQTSLEPKATPEPELLTPSNQNTNLVSPFSNYAPTTPVESNSNTSDEMFEVILAEQFASLKYKTHNLPLKINTQTKHHQLLTLTFHKHLLTLLFHKHLHSLPCHLTLPRQGL